MRCLHWTRAPTTTTTTGSPSDDPGPPKTSLRSEQRHPRWWAAAREFLVSKRDTTPPVHLTAARAGVLVTDTAKRCARCNRMLPHGAFMPNPRMRSGLHSWCRECAADRTRQWREENWDRINEHRLELARNNGIRPQLSERTCSECGERFVGRPNAVTCGATCRKRRSRRLQRERDMKDPERARERRANSWHRRREAAGRTLSGKRSAVRLEELARRDGYRCHICGRKVNMSLQVPDLLAPTRDHIVPLSQGGTHTPENVSLAHFGCNVSRGNRGGLEQLRLIG